MPTERLGNLDAPSWVVLSGVQDPLALAPSAAPYPTLPPPPPPPPPPPLPPALLVEGIPFYILTEAGGRILLNN